MKINPKIMELYHKLTDVLPAPVKLFISGVISIFTPIWFLCLGIGMAIMLEYVTAVVRMVSVDGWSKKIVHNFGSTMLKMLIYQSVILTLYFIDYHIINEMLSNWLPIYIVTKIISLFIIGTEAILIKSNIETIFNVSFSDTLKQISSGIKEIKEGVDDVSSSKGDNVG